MSGVMGGTMRPASESAKHTPGAAVLRLDRAHARARYATTAIPSRTLGKHWGVSAATARSLRTRVPKGPLTKLLALIADPSVDCGPIVAAVLSAYEERAMYAPSDVLRARRDKLRNEEEHRLQAEQDRAMVVNCPNRADAYRQHAAALIELATLEEILS